MDSKKIINALDNPSSFEIDQKILEKFKAKNNKETIKTRLSKRIIEMGCQVNGDWFLDNLLMRLPGHGVKHNFQFANDPDSFFYWLDQVQNGDPYDEDKAWREEKIKINIKESLIRQSNRLKHRVKSKIKQIIS